MHCSYARFVWSKTVTTPAEPKEPNIEKLAQQIEKTGGKKRSKVWQLWPEKPYKVCYCEDPWGNIIELSSHSYEQTWSNFEIPHKPE